MRAVAAGNVRPKWLGMVDPLGGLPTGGMLFRDHLWPMLAGVGPSKNVTHLRFFWQGTFLGEIRLRSFNE